MDYIGKHCKCFNTLNLICLMSISLACSVASEQIDKRLICILITKSEFDTIKRKRQVFP